MTIQAITPDFGRLESYSALDFAYWVLTNVDISLSRSESVFEFQGSYDDEDLCMETIRTALDQVGIAIPETFDTFYADCSGNDQFVSQEKAFRMRGSLLFRGRGIAMSLGDDRRITEIRDGLTYVRYLTDIEREPGYWQGSTVLEMVYL